MLNCREYFFDNLNIFPSRKYMSCIYDNTTSPTFNHIKRIENVVKRNFKDISRTNV